MLYGQLRRGAADELPAVRAGAAPSADDRPARRARHRASCRSWSSSDGWCPGAARRLPPDLEPGKPQRYLLFEAVVSLLAAAKGTPLLLVIDDLQWADELDAAPAAPRPRRPRARGHDGRRDHAPRGAASRRIPSSPRSIASAAASRASASGASSSRGSTTRRRGVLVGTREQHPVDPSSCAALREATAGNPFFIEETLRGLSERYMGGDPVAACERARRSVGGARGDPAPAREAGAGDGPAADVRRGLRAASSGSTSWPRCTGSPRRTPSPRSERHSRRGSCVEPAVDRFAFRHALIREALYAQIESRTERARLHLAAGEALERLEAPAAELARHFHAAMAVGGAGKALGYGVEAAKQAAGRSPTRKPSGTAATRCERSTRSGSNTRASGCSPALGRLHWPGRRRHAARATFRRAADLAQRTDDPEQLARAALGFAGRWYDAERRDQELIELLEQALELLPPGDLRLACAAARRARVGAGVQPHAARARELSAEAVAMATRIGDAGVLLSVLPGRHASLCSTSPTSRSASTSAPPVAAARRPGQGSRERGAGARLAQLRPLRVGRDRAGAPC